jgi:SAM-dependent methyltransferase
MSNCHQHPFNRSGLAALSDLQTQEWREIFNYLEKEQASFLEKEKDFRSPEYKWPRDPLHTWSRVWEYPYVYYHLKAQRNKFDLSSPPTVVDFGSGVTFLPFTIAKLGYEVICMDTDMICGQDIERATSVVEQFPGKVYFRRAVDGKLPLRSNDVDILYCISVLEHIEDIKRTLEEIYRVLKVGGLLIFTIDVDTCGYLNLSLNKYYNLRKYLLSFFKLTHPEITIHPMDVLHPRNSPFPFMTYSCWQRLKFHVIQRLKPWLRKKPLPMLPDLSIWAGIMTKCSL